MCIVVFIVTETILLFVKGSTESKKEYEDEEQEEYIREWNNKRRERL